ncbi:MAG: DNA cytosine methyltransferase [Bacteroidetes bacterium]|nr:DNA cytosine methyltransferase [Bacteroidota bacterium]
MIYKNKKHTNNITYIDLFAGIGGFHLAFDSLKAKCLFASDIDIECRKTYELNYKMNVFGDIKQVNEDKIPDHDILCAGFPCQPFSICGRQKGFADSRGNLFFDILKIIKAKNPKVIFLENVKHLKHHNKGQTLETILFELENIGYKTSWKILNSKDFGTAQNRERIIVIANKENKFDFAKLQQKSQIYLKDILDENGDFEFLDKNEYTIIDNSLWIKQKSGLIFCGYRNKTIRKTGVRPKTEHLSRVHKQPNRIYHINGTHPTIPSQETSGRFWIYDGKNVRKLTINECFKLMGFSNKFIKVSTNGKLYNQIGNSVSVPMIETIGKEIINQYFKVEV